MYRHVLNKKSIKSQIKLFLTDVDGTLTDGGMYYSEEGDELKKFNTRDGMGISMLHNAGIKVGIITSENCQLNLRRAKKLKVDYIYQGEKNKGKLAIAEDIAKTLGITMQNIAYIGDDINCYELLSHVGYAACPSDANNKLKSIPGISIMSKKGGDGCVREFIEMILS
jgi:YrbI family 3-deoxy-D-manno-octulosonate 8-phosphate phosphatase